MKAALRWIPTEVWVDVFSFPWISRQELGRIVDRIGNRYIAEILQYCLHERGKRSLSKLFLDKDALIPQTPLPENIKCFDFISIQHFDSSAHYFLRQINTLFHSNDVNLHLMTFGRDDLANLRTILHHVAPLIHGIHSMAFHQNLIPLVQQYFAPKLAQVKLLTLDIDFWYSPIDPAATEAAINFCLNWLISGERDPAEPRSLEVYISLGIFQQFTTAIQKQFLMAKRPSTFTIELIVDDEEDNDLDFHLDLKNTIGEKLHGGYDGHFQIIRHPVNFERTKLEEWMEETYKERRNGIRFAGKLCIGPIDAIAGDIEVNDGGEEADDQPFTSDKQ